MFQTALLPTVTTVPICSTQTIAVLNTSDKRCDYDENSSITMGFRSVGHGPCAGCHYFSCNSDGAPSERCAASDAGEVRAMDDGAMATMDWYVEGVKA